MAILLRNLRQGLTLEEAGSRLEFRATNRFPDKPIKAPENVRAVETEQSNSTALVDNEYVVKVYRKVEAGINPEIEMGRFLTEVAGFAKNSAPLRKVEMIQKKKRHPPPIVYSFVQKKNARRTLKTAHLEQVVD